MRRVLGLSVIVLLLRLGLQVLAGADVRGASEVRQQHMSEQDINFQQERVQATSKGEKEKGQQRCATHPLGHSTEHIAVKERPKKMMRGSAASSQARRHDGLISLSTPS
jgi:Ni/Co efflux regulator RcnB